MIKDLEGAGHVSASADVVVVGGGTAGLLTSVWLAEAGHNVICIESGGWHQISDTHPLNEVVQLRSVYAGAASGRFRCIGGTSTRWGGALIPFQPADLTMAGWPIGMAELAPYVSKVEQQFHLRPGSYEADDIAIPRGSHVARLAKWPPFKNRNVYQLVADRCRTLENLHIWLNSTVTEFEAGRQALKSVSARNSGGDSLAARAPRFIFAAGAIETTRLALLVDRAVHPEHKDAGRLGQYFSDHLSIEVGDLSVSRPAELNKHVGFRFERNGTMRNLRFELANDSPLRREVVPSFAHISFETDGSAGFDRLRGIYRELQKRRLPSIADMVGLIRTAPWLVRAVWARFVDQRLLFPDDARFKVNMVIEQRPSADNRITLSNDRTDPFGNPLAEISWGVSSDDAAGLTRAVDAFEGMWESLPLSRFAGFKRSARGAAEAGLANGAGIYHPTGSTRMAGSSEEGAVDTDLRMFSVPNVQLLATSVLPTGGGANPTMMLLLLAARAVDHFDRA